MRANTRALRKALFVVASQQAGYFTAAQALDVGYSYPAQAHHVHAGNWHRIDRGIFRLAEWVPEVHDDLVRWSLWSKGRGVVSHETALAVDGLGEFESARVHLTVPTAFTMRDPALTLHHVDLPAADVGERVGFRVTTPARSIIDVASGAPDEEQLARAIDDARDRGFVSLPSLAAKAEATDPRAALYIERAIRQLDRS